MSTRTSTPWLGVPDGVQQPQRPARDAEPDDEDRQALQLVPQPVGRAADAEGETPVGRGVADRGEQERQQVGGLAPDRSAEREVEDGVRDRRRTPTSANIATCMPSRPPRASAEARPSRSVTSASGSRPATQVAAEPDDAAHVVVRRAQRCRPGCRGRRPSRPAPRGCAAPPARRGPAARCRRTRRRPRPAAAPRAATSRRIALNPHCASENRVRSARAAAGCSRGRSPRASGRGSPATRARSRVPIARSEWPLISGATSGSSALRSVDRSTSM